MNDFLHTQLTAGFDEESIGSRITDIKGNPLNSEDRQAVFKGGKFGYDFNKKKVTIYNPNASKTKVLVTPGIMS